MTVGSSYDNGVLRVFFSGELDHHAAKKTVEFIEKKIDAHLPREMVLDMKDLSFMDSSGIAVVLKAYRRMNEVGGAIQVENAGKQPLRVLTASSVDRIVKIIAVTKEA